MPTLEQMRIEISNVYPNTTWENKVKRMADNQVIAIYNKFLKDGKLVKKRESHRKGQREEQLRMAI